jgi:hypothetical protein
LSGTGYTYRRPPYKLQSGQIVSHLFAREAFDRDRECPRAEYRVSPA